MACGDDEGDLDLGDEPTISVPDTPATEPAQVAPAEQTDEQGSADETEVEESGGVAVPGPEEPSYDPDGIDSPENDKPPRPGSPEAAFEQACSENPDDCG